MSETAADLSMYGLVAAVLPLLIALINRPSFPTWLRGVVMLAASIIAGVTVYGANNAWDFTSLESVMTAVVGVVAATQVAYYALWKQNGIASVIEKGVNSGTTTPTEVDDVDADQDIEEDEPAEEDDLEYFEPTDDDYGEDLEEEVEDDQPAEPR